MSAHTSPVPRAHALRRLQDAIATDDRAAILAAIPEPPAFLKTLFGLEAADRDAILAGVFPVLDTDEDTWEIIEAAAMDSIVRPERGSFVAVAPYIPADMLDDARKLVVQFPTPYVAEAQRALDARSVVLGISK